jgi:membrane protease YdiL (CAAX protease family)
MLKRLHIPASNRQALSDRISSRAWTTPQIGIVLGGLFLFYFFASFTGCFFYEEQIPQVRLAVTFLLYLSILALIIFINRRRGDSWSSGYGMGYRQLNKLALSPLIYLVTLPFLIAAAKGWHLLLEKTAGQTIELQEVAQVVTQELSWLQILTILMAVSVAPFFEEIVFRGIAFPYFVKHAGLAKGTLLVSVLFAVLHFHLPSLIPLMLLSALLCLVYWRSGSLWIGIGIHGIFNTVSILVLNLTRM